jgi:hypothetical protein
MLGGERTKYTGPSVAASEPKSTRSAPTLSISSRTYSERHQEVSRWRLGSCCAWRGRAPAALGMAEQGVVQHERHLREPLREPADPVGIRRSGCGVDRDRHPRLGRHGQERVERRQPLTVGTRPGGREPLGVARGGTPGTGSSHLWLHTNHPPCSSLVVTGSATTRRSPIPGHVPPAPGPVAAARIATGKGGTDLPSTTAAPVWTVVWRSGSGGLGPGVCAASVTSAGPARGVGRWPRPDR